MKKTFNLQEYREYRKAQDIKDIEGPDMSKFNITKLEMMKEKLEKKYPNVSWTLAEVKKWIDRYIFDQIPPLKWKEDREWKE